jgi:hypothetical protein
MGSLNAAISTSSAAMARRYPAFVKAPTARLCRSPEPLPGCPEWSGIPVRHAPESVSDIVRNPCPTWPGTRSSTAAAHLRSPTARRSGPRRSRQPALSRRKPTRAVRRRFVASPRPVPPPRFERGTPGLGSNPTASAQVRPGLLAQTIQGLFPFDVSLGVLRSGEHGSSVVAVGDPALPAGACTPSGENERSKHRID